MLLFSDQNMGVAYFDKTSPLLDHRGSDRVRFLIPARRDGTDQNPQRQRGALGVVCRADIDNGNVFTVTINHQGPSLALRVLIGVGVRGVNLGGVLGNPSAQSAYHT